MKKKFIKDGFQQQDFFVGAVVIFSIVLLLFFGKFILIGMALMIGVLVSVTVVGFIGKGFSAYRNKNKPDEEETEDEAPQQPDNGSDTNRGADEGATDSSAEETP